MHNYLVIDVGGTAIKYAIMNTNLTIDEKGSMPTPLEGLAAFTETLEQLIFKYRDRVDGVAMSMPGLVNSKEAYMYTGGAMDSFLHEYPLGKVLAEKTGLPVTIENDGRCAALAEVWKGNLCDCQDGIVIVIGTALGGAIIKDRQIHQGKHFAAGDLSCILLGDDYTDLRSCWGSVNGNYHLREMVGQAKGISADMLDGIKIFEMANAGDQEVLKALDQFFFTLAKQIYNLQMIYDPDRVLIGGGISVQPLVKTLIQKKLDAIFDNIPLNVHPTDLQCCKFLSEANLVGALKHHLDIRNIAN